MPRFLFTTGITRGSFTAVESDGEFREVAGLDLVLGQADGLDAYEALTKFFSIRRDIPAYMQQHVTVFEVGKAIRIPYHCKISPEELRENVHLGSGVALSATSAPVKNEVTGGYKTKKCEWCSEEVPSNGAAQFSHLKGHLNKLMTKKLLTKEEVHSVRSLKLEQKIKDVLAQFYNK